MAVWGQRQSIIHTGRRRKVTRNPDFDPKTRNNPLVQQQAKSRTPPVSDNRLKSDAGMTPIVRHFVNSATMRRKDCNCFDRFLHCAMLRIAAVEMTG